MLQVADSFVQVLWFWVLLWGRTLDSLKPQTPKGNLSFRILRFRVQFQGVGFQR